MENEHVVSGLIRKRAEIAGRVEKMQTDLRQLMIDLDHLDETIRMFAPDVDILTIRPKPMPPKHQAYRGELTGIVLSMLRHHPGGMTTPDLAKHVMAERGLDTSDPQMMRMMAKRVGAALRHQRRAGIARAIKRSDALDLWTLF